MHAPRQSAHADDRGDRGQRARRRSRARAGCDIRVASETREARPARGATRGDARCGGTQRLPRVVGVGRAKELTLTGRIIDAHEAERIGLVSRVVPAGQARAAADEIASEIAQRGPLAVREVKRLIDQSADLDIDAGIAAEIDASERVFDSEDMLEGAAAFFAKRPPDYNGVRGERMTDIDRFGVFLPSYVWEGDGPDRARGIKEFARAVEDLGFDSLFVTDHLIAAKRFYSVSFLEPLAGAGSRGRRDLARPAGHLDPDHAAAPSGDAGEGARDAAVPVREPRDPRRRRWLERVRVRGAGRARSRSAASAPTRCSTS